MIKTFINKERKPWQVFCNSFLLFMASIYIIQVWLFDIGDKDIVKIATITSIALGLFGATLMTLAMRSMKKNNAFWDAAKDVRAQVDKCEDYVGLLGLKSRIDELYGLSTGLPHGAEVKSIQDIYLTKLKYVRPPGKDYRELQVSYDGKLRTLHYRKPYPDKEVYIILDRKLGLIGYSDNGLQKALDEYAFAYRAYLEYVKTINTEHIRFEVVAKDERVERNGVVRAVYDFKTRVLELESKKNASVSRFVGSSTVWHTHPSFRRCGTRTEGELSEWYTLFSFYKNKHSLNNPKLVWYGNEVSVVEGNTN